MKDMVVVIVYMLALIAMFSIVGFLIYQGKDGWGWILFVGLLIFGNINISMKEDSDVGSVRKD